MNVREKYSLSRITGAIGAGLLVVVATSLACSAVTACLISAGRMNISSEGYAIMLTLLISAAASAVVVSIKLPKIRLISCLLSGCGYVIGLLGCGALFFDGVKGGLFSALVVILAGDIAVYLLGMRRNKGMKYRPGKYRI
jgi:hypothetical protein